MLIFLYFRTNPPGNPHKMFLVFINITKGYFLLVKNYFSIKIYFVKANVASLKKMRFVVF